jgi:hypothetical protein
MTKGSAEKNSTNYRFSGHETFPCRYPWLPKAFQELRDDAKLFADEEKAMVRLGVGKNMARAIRFWVQVAGVASPDGKGGLSPTPFGTALLSVDGFDPYLEDLRTLWLLHWKIASQVAEPLFAWEYLLNRWVHPEITRTEVLKLFTQEAARLERSLSEVTLEQHFDVFLHTYVPTRSAKGDVREDNLDCPLVELGLIFQVGDRRSGASGRTEAVYAFNRDPKPGITAEVFAYCLDDFWHNRRRSEATLTFRDVAIGMGSMGQLFKLPEADVRDRLTSIAADSHGAFQFHDSAAQAQISRGSETPDLLTAVYQQVESYA